MTTFSGQSCVLGTAESCGLRLEECGAFTCVETRMGQEMGSIAAAVFWLGATQRWRAAGYLRRAALGRSTPGPATSEALTEAVNCDRRLAKNFAT